MPRIIGRMKRSRLAFTPFDFRTQSVNDLRGNDIPIITDKIFYV